MENPQKITTEDISPLRSGAAKVMWGVFGVAACISVAAGIFLYFSPAEVAEEEYFLTEEAKAAAAIEEDLKAVHFDDLDGELNSIEQELR